MTIRALAKPKNKNSTTLSLIFGNKPSGKSFYQESANEDRDLINSYFGHNFGNVQVESGQYFKQSCPPMIQTKLNIGKPGDKYEQEADRVADEVIRMLGPQMKLRIGNDLSKVNVYDNPSKLRKPAKALGEVPEEREREKPSPKQGGATIQCDGSGGYDIVYNGWAGAACGTKKCVTAHESSHIVDWKAKWPTGCQGQAKGYLPKGDPPDKPLMTVSEYNAFLKKSECKAHTVDLECAKVLPKPVGCKKTVDDYISLTERQRKNWCPSLPGWARFLIGAGGGALAGAGVGALVGGPVGAAVGAGIGAVVGGIAGLFF